MKNQNPRGRSRKTSEPRTTKKRGPSRPKSEEAARAKRAPAHKAPTRTFAEGKKGKKRPGMAAPPPATASTPEVSARVASAFPVVGIGSSAGGLEALELFLSRVPEGSGMAYVVVQHLDPVHKGAMVELLQRVSTMPVVEAKDCQVVEPDQVYVIPPNRDMSILDGALHLVPQKSPRGLNLPIDFFFRSLAEDQQERSIGVVLSGMGSDGTLGLRAIKENAGAGFVQSLSSAKFDSMPRSAIEAGLADVIAPAEELPARIVAYQRHTPHLAKPEITLEEKQQSGLEKVFVLLRTHTGNDFSLYKKSTIYRRIERRMGLHQIDRISGYVRYLRDNPQEIDLLFKELLIGVTSFFRDAPVWEQLKCEILPELLQSRAQTGLLRAWVPGCSTGEEAYSLAVVLREAAEQLRPERSLTFQIFATDLDRDAIEKARLGIYPANIAADVSPARLRRFFVQEDHGFRVRKEIREMVVFAPQNIIMDPPFTKVDVLSSRNVLIYLSAELQKKLIPLFHYTLNPGGVLFLGSAETVGTYSNLFNPLDTKARLYQRLDTTVGAPAVEFPSSFVSSTTRGAEDPRSERLDLTKATPHNLQVLVDRVIAQRLSPATVLTNDKGDILYITGRTGKYLEPAAGRANLNVIAMAREGLRYELSGALSKALREERPVILRGVRVTTNGSSQIVDVSVQKLVEPKELRGTVMIVFADVPDSAAPKTPEKGTRLPAGARVRELERDLQQVREDLQTTREEMQTSQEELKSTNEELQSTNEELQSSNEELTTSKEEMQSMNEELQTVNHELQAKVEELSRSNNDMKNLLNSTDIATLFLDGELLVRRFTTQTTKLIKLIPGDAGRPITDIATELEYPDLADDAREVLRTLVFKVKQVTARDGHWYTVRVMPYRTLENVIDGLVITFTDTSAAKQLETALREQASQLRQLTESLPNLVWRCRPDGACDYLSHQWVAYTGVPEGEQLGYGWLEQVHPEDRERIREEWKTAVKTGVALNTEFRIRPQQGAHRWFKARSTPIRDETDAVVKWYGTCTDVDDLKQMVELRAQTTERLAGILEGISDAFFALDRGLVITHFNSAAERVLARHRADVVGRAFFDVFPEAGGSIFEEKLRLALEQQRASSFSAQCTKIPPCQWYNVRVYAHAKGLSVFLQPADSTPPPPRSTAASIG